MIHLSVAATTHRILYVSTVLLVPAVLVPAVLAAEDLPATAERPTPLHAIDAKSPAGLKRLLSYTGEPLPVVSAHRGGALPGFPENCLATFENTLRHAHAIMEVDPRYTRDGRIVLHHDATLDRTTTGRGRLADHDLSELTELRLKDPAGSVTDYRILTLDEALEWARGKTILILDEKDVPVAARVKKIEQHGAESYAMLIVYSLGAARECYELNGDIMMEVMITRREQFEAFDKSGIPWSNVVAFVGHRPPRDRELLAMIHAKGALCIAGTSRHLDRELAPVRTEATPEIERKYRALLDGGVDLFEADLAADVGRMLYRDMAVPERKARFFPSAVAARPAD